MDFLKSIGPARLYYIILGAHGLFFYIVATVAIVYHVEMAQLNALQLVLVGTTLELAVLIFEIPTGVIADAISRRSSVIIGHMLIGVGFMFEGMFPDFILILIANVAWGAGHTFISGAREAWVADETRESDVGKVFLRGTQVFQILAFVGIWISVAIAALTQINIPVVVGGALFSLFGILLIFIMSEKHFKPTPKEDRNTWGHMKDTLQRGTALIRQKPVLTTILIIALLLGLASEGFDRLWQKHVIEDITLPAFLGLDSVIWFGLIYSAAMLLTAAGTAITKRRLDTENHAAVARTLFISNLIVAVGIVSFGLAQGLAIGLAMYWVVMTLREVADPITLAWINQKVVSEVRATVLSIRSLADALGQVLAAPIVGLIGLFLSVPAAIVTAGALWLLAVPFYLRALRQED